jgi:MFS family permease
MTKATYRWVIVAAGGLLGCVAFGALFSLPVFLVPIAQATGWSRTGVSSAMTIAFLATACSSMAWGSLVDRYGPKPVVVSGAVLLAVGLALAGQARSLIEFQLVFGLVGGMSVAAIFAPMMATVTGWFDTHRSLAVSLVSAGIGVAPMTMSPFAAWLITQLDWRTCMLVLAGVVVVLMVPAALLVRRPPAPEGQRQADGTPAEASDMTVAEAVASPQFVVLLLTNFACCATHAGPIFHTVSYAMSCGIAPLAAVSIYSVEGLAGLGGRVAFGLLGDRLGAKRVLVAGLFVQAIGALLYFFVRELDEFYAVAALFGFTYAGVMPLYAVIAREYFPLKMMGTIIGGTSMAGSLGMALGPLAGGWIYDAYASYGWLYLGSFGLGLGATLIAASFRFLPKPQARSTEELKPIGGAT